MELCNAATASVAGRGKHEEARSKARCTVGPSGRRSAAHTAAGGSAAAALHAATENSDSPDASNTPSGVLLLSLIT